MNNFAISAMGRSGTRFLAITMNQSKKWMVRHEPGKSLVADPKMVAARFHRREYYGEVNSYLRHVLLRLPVERRGVILRDPRDILISVMRRSGIEQKLAQWRMDIIALGYLALDEALRYANVVSIRFEKMTTDVGYLQIVLEGFGIADVQVSEEILAHKVNVSKRGRIGRYTDVPDVVRRYYEAQTDWYREKYYGPL